MPNIVWTDRIVVGVDGSEASKAAARWAAREASLRGRGLTLVHAVLPPIASSAFGPGLPIGLDSMDEMRTRSLAELDAIASTLPTTDITTHMEIASPSGVLISASMGAEMVVLGSRGHGGFRGLLLGSVSTQVAAHSQCPVVVIRDQPAPGAQAVVVGIDGGPATSAALEFAFDTASRHGWKLIAVHAWEVPSYDLLMVPNAPIPVPLGDVADDEIRLAAEVLSGFEAAFPDVDVEQRLVRGTAVRAILDASAEAALVVVGTRGHGQVLGSILGSVSNGVLHKAHVPVAIVPSREPEPSAA